MSRVPQKADSAMPQLTGETSKHLEQADAHIGEIDPIEPASGSDSVNEEGQGTRGDNGC